MTLTHRFFAAAVLVVWGGVLAWFSFTGRVASYLHPAFHPWTAISAVMLLLLAAGVLFLPDGGDCGDGCEHGSLKGRVVPGFILLVPLVAAAAISPSQFGSIAVANRGYIESIGDLPGYQPFAEPALPSDDGKEQQPGETPVIDYLPRNAAGQIKVEPVDLLYAADEPAMRADFENKEVELVGQLMPAPSNNPQGNRFRLVRMFVMCCAADARPVAVTIQGKEPAGVGEMSWVKVSGRAAFPVEGGRRFPLVLAENVAICEPPEETFVYQ